MPNSGESPTFYHCVAFHIPVWSGVSHNLYAMPNILAQVMLKPLLIIQYVRLIQTVNPCQGPQFCYLELSTSDQIFFFNFFKKLFLALSSNSIIKDQHLPQLANKQCQCARERKGWHACKSEVRKSGRRGHKG